MAICHTVTIKSFLNALFPNILDLLHTLTFSLHFGLQFFGTTVYEKKKCHCKGLPHCVLPTP